jgi:hypothetical protein
MQDPVLGPGVDDGGGGGRGGGYADDPCFKDLELGLGSGGSRL